MTKSNCHLTAWKKFCSGKAKFISLQFTKNSKIFKFCIDNPILRVLFIPFRILEILVQLLAWPLVHIGELLRSGRWYHVTWYETILHKEFVPIKKVTKKWFPPLIFEGKEQEVLNETT